MRGSTEYWVEVTGGTMNNEARGDEKERITRGAMVMAKTDAMKRCDGREEKQRKLVCTDLSPFRLWCGTHRLESPLALCL